MKYIFDFAIFILFSLCITYLSNKLPESTYSWENRIFRVKEWEKSGEIYQELFRVKQWKKLIPELNDFVKSVFPKKKIMEFSDHYLHLYLFESCKAELTHWGIILSSFLFFLWEEAGISLVISVIAAVVNLPYIIIQRYNRPRITKIIHSMDTYQKKLSLQ